MLSIVVAVNGSCLRGSNNIVRAAVSRKWLDTRTFSLTEGRCRVAYSAGKVLAVLLLLIVAMLSFTGTSAAASYPQTISRTILALYDGSHEIKPYATRIHKFAQMPLNHLGFKLTYWDVSKGLPDPKTTKSHSRVLTWFDTPLKTHDAYLAWAKRAAENGTKFVVLGNIGVSLEDQYLPSINAFFAMMGLEFGGKLVEITYKAKIRYKNKAMMEFERPLDMVLPAYPVVKSIRQDVKSHLTLYHRSQLDISESQVVTSSARGGYAPSGYVVAYDSASDRTQWQIDPFKFFSANFSSKPFPIPDTTTISGRRIFFSHIDGDGWNNLSQIEKYRRDPTLSAEVVMNKLIAPYPNLPVTVSVIAGDVDPKFNGTKEARDIAKQIFRMPQVEIASHTYTHPYDWEFFDGYSRRAEEKLIKEQAFQPLKPYQKAVKWLGKVLHLKHLGNSDQPYVATTDDLPRTYLKKPFDLKMEIAGALDVANSLAPTGKRAAVYQWSGDTNPYEAAIDAVKAAGAVNINGGDSRFDEKFPSIAYVPPISRPVGKLHQIYAVNSNENTYTNDWTGPYYGFRFLEQTLDKTESPRRLKPVNVYYHMYSGEKLAALDAVKYHLDKARNGAVIPVKTSRYVSLAESFYKADITALGPNTWSVQNRGHLQTLRFDNATELTVDFTRSVGIIGQNRHMGSLYVALDPAVIEVKLALSPAAPKTSKSKAALPYLVESRWRLSNLKRHKCGFSFKAAGYGKGDMTWAGVGNQQYAVTAKRAGKTVWQQTMVPVKNARLKLDIGIKADDVPLELNFKCVNDVGRAI